MEPYDDSWRQEQNKTIGGSSVSTVLGINPFTTREEYWLERKGKIAKEDLSDNPDVLRGSLMERVAMEVFEKETGERITPHDQTQFIYHKKYPFAHTLPDGWLHGSPVEIKVPRPPTYNEWVLTGVPGHHVAQCLHHLALTDAETCIFIALHPVEMSLIIVPIPRDQDLIDKIMAAEKKFNTSLMVDVYPGARNPDDVEVEVPPSDGDLVVVDSPEARAAAESYVEWDDLLKEAEESKKIARRRLLEEVKGADRFEVTNVARFANAQCKGRMGFDAKSCMKRYPETEEFARQGAPYRVLKIIKKFV